MEYHDVARRAIEQMRTLRINFLGESQTVTLNSEAADAVWSYYREAIGDEEAARIEREHAPEHPIRGGTLYGLSIVVDPLAPRPVAVVGSREEVR